MPHDFNTDQPVQLMPLCAGVEINAVYKYADGGEWREPVIGFAILESGDGLRWIVALVPCGEGGAEDPGCMTDQFQKLEWRRVPIKGEDEAAWSSGGC